MFIKLKHASSEISVVIGLLLSFTIAFWRWSDGSDPWRDLLTAIIPVVFRRIVLLRMNTWCHVTWHVTSQKYFEIKLQQNTWAWSMFLVVFVKLICSRSIKMTCRSDCTDGFDPIQIRQIELRLILERDLYCRRHRQHHNLVLKSKRVKSRAKSKRKCYVLAFCGSAISFGSVHYFPVSNEHDSANTWARSDTVKRTKRS